MNKIDSKVNGTWVDVWRELPVPPHLPFETVARALRSARATQLGPIHDRGDEKSDIAERCYDLGMQLLYSVSFAASSANISATWDGSCILKEANEEYGSQAERRRGQHQPPSHVQRRKVEFVDEPAGKGFHITLRGFATIRATFLPFSMPKTLLLGFGAATHVVEIKPNSINWN